MSNVNVLVIINSNHRLMKWGQSSTLWVSALSLLKSCGLLHLTTTRCRELTYEHTHKLNTHTHTHTHTHTYIIHPVWHKPPPELSPLLLFPPFVLALFHHRSSQCSILLKLLNVSSFSRSCTDKKVCYNNVFPCI